METGDKANSDIKTERHGKMKGTEPCQGFWSLHCWAEQLNLCDSEKGEEQYCKGRGDAGVSQVEQHVCHWAGQALRFIVWVDEEKYPPGQPDEDHTDVEGEKISSGEESRESMEAADINGAVDGKKDKESSREVDVSLPGNRPH